MVDLELATMKDQSFNLQGVTSMTNKELIKIIRANKCKLYVPMLTPDDIVHVIAEKQAMIDMYSERSDVWETGMEIRVTDGVMWMDTM